MKKLELVSSSTINNSASREEHKEEYIRSSYMIPLSLSMALRHEATDRRISLNNLIIEALDKHVKEYKKEVN